MLLVLFVGSGCAALIYEIVWLQLLQLVIGSTAVSLGVLLGTFMGGMCLGSLLLAAPDLAAAASPAGLCAARAWASASSGSLSCSACRCRAASTRVTPATACGDPAARGWWPAVCLLPPTLLMGATLPAIARWVETTPQGVSWLGFFYGGNIAGAVFGCLLAGFYLLRVHDMATATYVAAGVNVAVAADRAWPWRRPDPVQRRRPTARRRRVAGRAPVPGRSMWRSPCPGCRRWAPKWSGRVCCR